MSLLLAHLRHAVLSDARPLCTQEQTSAADQEGPRPCAECHREAGGSRAADLAPTIKQLQAAGNTTLRALAAGLNAMGITTARGGNWDQTQVCQLLVRPGEGREGEGRDRVKLGGRPSMPLFEC
jgi:hypothetical protein